jgi:hypothetical protein
MKIGDLVELSAYGKKRLYNRRLQLVNTGLVVGTRRDGKGIRMHHDDIRVIWYPGGLYSFHERIEIKFAKIKKKT